MGLLGLEVVMRTAGVLGLVFLAAADLLLAGGVLAGGLAGPPVALAAEYAGIDAAETFAGAISLALLTGAGLLALAALRLGRSRLRVRPAAAVGTGLSAAALALGLPQTQPAFAVFTVVLGWLLLTSAAESAAPPRP
ncbi:MAG: hypothetical protein Kow00129_02350 [Thermoleophilia bacterium]